MVMQFVLFEVGYIVIYERNVDYSYAVKA